MRTGSWLSYEGVWDLPTSLTLQGTSLCNHMHWHLTLAATRNVGQEVVQGGWGGNTSSEVPAGSEGKAHFPRYFGDKKQHYPPWTLRTHIGRHGVLIQQGGSSGPFSASPLQRWAKGERMSTPGTYSSFYLVYSFERSREREQETSIFSLLVHFPNGPEGRVWARGRQEPGTSSGFPMWVTGAQVLGSSRAIFPGSLAGSWVGSEAARTPTNTHQTAASSALPQCWPWDTDCSSLGSTPFAFVVHEVPAHVHV